MLTRREVLLMPILATGAFFGRIVDGTPPPDPGDYIAADGANAPQYSAVHSPAFYDAGLGKTFVAWEAWTGVRSEQVTSLDHATGYFSDVEGMGRSFLVDDEHGNPVIALDHENHLHAFYGAHNNLGPSPVGVKHSSTRWPVDGTALDGSKWEVRADIAGVYSYPHPVLVGSGFHLFLRTYSGGQQYPLTLRKTTALADGVATWGSEQALVDFGADSRVYQGNAVLVGTDIHFACTKADGSNTIHDNVYYFVYDTVTGALKNHDGSVSTASGSLPVSLATANSSYRINTHNGGYIPVLAFDTSGDPFVAFSEGTGTSTTVKVMKRSAGVWGSAETVGNTSGAFYHYALGPLPGGEMELLWSTDPDDDWPIRGGDIMRKVRSSGGTWGSAETILVATTHGLAGLNPVRNAHADARMTFTEVTQDAVPLDSVAGGLRVYLWGDGGLVAFQQAPAAGEAETAADGNELREDGGIELREDGTNELREAILPITLPDGIWSWFSDPRAISIGGDPVVGAITSAGNLVVYDAANSLTPVDLRGSTFQVDDHANPSLLRRASDGRIIAFASAHNGSALYTYLSTNPDDISAFGAETNIDAALGLSDYAYTYPVQLTDETNDPIYLFFRALEGATRHFQYSKSTDGGATWAAATRLLSNNGASASHPPYVKLAQNGNDRIDFFCTDGHPDTVATNSIYHFYYQGGSFRDTAGAALTLPILPATDLTPLYAGSGTGGRAWVQDAAIDGSGNPVVVYATYANTSSARYRYARWNGSSWDDNHVGPAGGYLYSGQPHYAGCAAIDPLDVDVVYLSRGYAGEGNHRIWRCETADGGATWTTTRKTSSGHAFRPAFVRGQTGAHRVAYVHGTYTTFTDYNTEIALLADDGTGEAVTTDPMWADVVLQIQPSGANGSTTFVNEAYVRGTITARGNAQVNSNEILLDGTDDCLTLADSDLWRLAQGCTVEMGVKFASSAGTQTLISQYYTFINVRSFMLRYNAGSLEVFVSSDGSTDTAVIDYTWTPTLNQEYHIGVDWASNTMRLLIDGVPVATAALSLTLFNSTTELAIGGRRNSGSTFQHFLNGRITRLRITNGAAIGNAAPTLRYPGSSYSVPSSFPSN